jgi:hypothetical protein
MTRTSVPQFALPKSLALQRCSEFGWYREFVLNYWKMSPQTPSGGARSAGLLNTRPADPPRRPARRAHQQLTPDPRGADTTPCEKTSTAALVTCPPDWLSYNRLQKPCHLATRFGGRWASAAEASEVQARTHLRRSRTSR